MQILGQILRNIYNKSRKIRYIKCLHPKQSPCSIGRFICRKAGNLVLSIRWVWDTRPTDRLSPFGNQCAGYSSVRTVLPPHYNFFGKMARWEIKLFSIIFSRRFQICNQNLKKSVVFLDIDIMCLEYSYQINAYAFASHF